MCGACGQYDVMLLFQILIQSVCETMVPKLVAEDIPLLHSLLSDVFPGVEYTNAQMDALKEQLKKVCADLRLVYGEGIELGSQWVEKVRLSLCLQAKSFVNC